MERERERFITPCRRTQSLSEKLAGEIFDQMETFAALRPSTSPIPPPTPWCPYQTAYLKAHYPEEFMAGVDDAGDGRHRQDLQRNIAECRGERGIRILPPDGQRKPRRFHRRPKPPPMVSGRCASGWGAVRGRRHEGGSKRSSRWRVEGRAVYVGSGNFVRACNRSRSTKAGDRKLDQMRRPSTSPARRAAGMLEGPGSASVSGPGQGSRFEGREPGWDCSPAGALAVTPSQPPPLPDVG